MGICDYLERYAYSRKNRDIMCQNIPNYNLYRKLKVYSESKLDFLVSRSNVRPLTQKEVDAANYKTSYRKFFGKSNRPR
ncbi:hypothetical protein HON86_03190 [Candidatus Woesearchaeota archaeon]|jgi:hypothetical protein|nr:hypothetical protein [Candidatus Woesearchaeota archaeon]MBT4835593.1 hypothetical protein [Candidatus Woesearchaeota archaeon]MBT6735203.1 hypothetical protein [Candidatus Woesearchaeota archaeon]MBT7169786.1 hypothetical protein [Candidatus Woesearchaeota archaeon]MBT7474459.1 hypothetical protein [Candidatus Woesearchaeota archaeon]